MLSTERDAARAIVDRFDLRALPLSFYEDPYPTYHALRSLSPVHRLPDGGIFLTRRDDMEAVYKDTSTFSSDKRVEFKPKFGETPLYEHHTHSLIFNDPPLHTRVRRLINGALTPRVIANMEGDLIRLIDDLLDRMATKPESDLIADYAAVIPIEVIGNLLDVPHDERWPLRDWSLAILGALEPRNTPESLAEGDKAVTDFCDYLRTLIARRRANPGDPDKDVLTRLIQGEASGERLSEIELLHNCIFILNAGHETTTNLIGNGLQALIEHSGERKRLIGDQTLIGTAIEEMLRFDAPVQLGNRLCTIDAEIAGVPVTAGTSVNMCIGGANRDPAHFPDPDRFDIGRRPNRHLAFVSGPHQCVGMSLARLEGKVAVAGFLARFPEYRTARAPVRGGRARFRGFLELPVVLG